MFIVIIVQAFIALAGEFEEFQCDIEIPGSVCINNGKIQLNSPYIDSYGYWNFDYDKVSKSELLILHKFFDFSLNHHITKRHQVLQVPSLAGFGNAASFERELQSQMNIYLVPFWEWIDWTLSFVLYFEELPIVNDDNFCPLINLYDEVFEQEFTTNMKIGLQCKTRKLIIQLEDKKKGKKQKKNQNSMISILLTSKATIQAMVWYKIYFRVNDRGNAQLFINGHADDGIELKSTKATWKHIQIGYTEEQYLFILLELSTVICPSQFLIDSLNLQTKSEIDAFIQAGSEQFQGNADLVYLNCDECVISQAKQCRLGYHLCGSVELYSFGLNTARDMGWSTKKNANFWTSSSNIDTIKNDQTGIGLCCRDIEYAQ